MRILELDEKRGILEVQIEDFTDIFVLWNFIRKGDIVEASTYRKIKFESGDVERIKLKLRIKVERIGFQEMSEVLKISGPILEGPDKYVSIGSYHTITVKKGMKLRIYREHGFDSEDLEILQEAEILSKISPIVIVAVERDEATVAILFSTKLNVVSTIYQTLSYKEARNEKALKNMFFKKIAEVVSNIISQYAVSGIIIAGPGLVKNELKDFILKHLKFDKKISILTDQAGSGTLSGIHEVLKRGTALRIVENHKIAISMQDYEKFLMHLGRGDNKAYYGLDVIEKLVSWGAVDRIYMVSDLIINDETHEKSLGVIREARKNGAKVEIISPNHPLYENIKSFGGIIALLKYPIKLGESYGVETA